MCMTIYPDESNLCNPLASRLDGSMLRLHVAAIDDQVLTGDIAGILRAQIRTETGHFLGTAEAVCRNALEEVRQELLVGQRRLLGAMSEKRLVVAAGIDEARRN